MMKKLSLRRNKPTIVQALDQSVDDFIPKKAKAKYRVDAAVSQESLQGSVESVPESCESVSQQVASLEVSPQESGIATQATVEFPSRDANREACPICNEPILLDVIKTHVLLCLKRYQNPKETAAVRHEAETSVDCAVCGKDLKLLTLDMRQAHVEKCLGNESSSANVFPTSNAASFASANSNQQNRRHLNPPTTCNQEDLHLAKAISLSLANKEGWGSLKPLRNANILSKRAKIRKGFQVAPTLLMRTADERIKLVNEEVAAVLVDDRDFRVYKSDAKIAADEWETIGDVDSFKERFMEKFPDILVQNFSKLWNLAALSDIEHSDVEDYYVAYLSWAIAVRDAGSVVKFKPLSQIPGRQSDRDIEARNSILRAAAEHDPTLSTQCVLEALKCPSQDNGGDAERGENLLFGSGGFCTQLSKEEECPNNRCEHSALVNGLGTLFRSGQYADVEIVAEKGERLRCHKVMLYARCPKLIDEIVDDVLADRDRNTKNPIILWEKVSFGAAKTFLRFLYTAEISTDEITKEIANLARWYDLPDLRQRCHMYDDESVSSEYESERDSVADSNIPSVEIVSKSATQRLGILPSPLSTVQENTDVNLSDIDTVTCDPLKEPSGYSDPDCGNRSDYGCLNSPDIFDFEVSNDSVVADETADKSTRKRRLPSECEVRGLPSQKARKSIRNGRNLGTSEPWEKRPKSGYENGVVVIVDVQDAAEKLGDVSGGFVLMNDSFENYAANTCDIWDGLEDDIPEVNPDCPVPTECQILKEMDVLGNGADARSSCFSPAVLVDDTDTSVEMETPKPDTIIQSTARLVKSNVVTPMPDYSHMDTPLLKVNLKKYGLRGQKRTKAVKLLKHVYDKTHPVVLESDSDEENYQTAEPDVRHEEAKLNSSQESTSSSCLSSMEEVMEECVLNLSSDEESNCKAMDPSNLANLLRKFFKRNAELHREILLYNPLSIDRIQEMLKLAHIRVQTKALINFLDDENIIFKMPRKKQKPRRARKVSRTLKQK